MRQDLFAFFFLATLPVAMVHAEPYATYNPATGDVTLYELRGLVQTSLHSMSGRIRTGVVAEVPAISPATAQLPKVYAAYEGSSFWVGWEMWTPLPPHDSFNFDSISFRSAVPAGTKISDLFMLYTPDGDVGYDAQIRLIPEPTTFAMSGLALLSLAALRRRK